jgi:Zn-dependent peptidase ImmA (M78 family)
MTIGERIKAARRMRGYSLRELGARIEQSHTAVAKYEEGRLPVSSAMLIQLSRALEIQIEYFLRVIEIPEVVPVFRKKHALRKKSQSSIIARAQEWLERYVELSVLMPSERQGFQMPTGFPRVVSSLEEAENAALELREAWDLGFDAIEDIVALLEEKGTIVLLLEAEEKFDACAFIVRIQKQEIPAFICRSPIPGDRQRFSLAHELGHLALEPTDDIDEEKAADRFAGAFLVPEPVVRRELGKARRFIEPQELIILKHKYGLSMGAWTRRARDVEVIAENTYEVLQRTFRKRGWHKTEPGKPYEEEVPKRFAQLIAQAMASDIIAEAKASELLGVPYRSFLDDDVKQWGGRLIALGS